jgi:hypothetical protein
MNYKDKKRKPPMLSQKDQLIEAMGIALALLLLVGSAVKILFL